MKSFHHKEKVLFQHCDPAGIVFYPRYFEMVNTVVETWFSEVLGHPFETLHGPMKVGVPTVHFEVSFHAPSLHGDVLDFELTPTRIGSASVNLLIVASSAEQKRLTMNTTLVFITLPEMSPTPWPELLRQRISESD
jgi:4-hydroxybenzoyl-CoA thioesterase